MVMCHPVRTIPQLSEGKVSPVHVMKELLAEKTPERVWAFSIGEKYLAPTGI
jgi:hypothetical protein